MLVIDAALRRFGGRLVALQLDDTARDLLPPSEWRRWRVRLAESLRALADTSPALPLQPRHVASGRIVSTLAAWDGRSS